MNDIQMLNLLEGLGYSNIDSKNTLWDLAHENGYTWGEVEQEWIVNEAMTFN
ncbi:hypothetical protein IFU39_16725 [Paenibacillus sp. CFBP 13594]|uniref:hypothetical protein n=1 Tax=Paenibacillus sp. CFBP 13594 TaxID=2774037 RepID=UPI00177F3123|nr:hypothetical protein [Paenibacillus sp. CFBP 13594]MBD8839459.1 hypothetical protein [Paenibacillus sp. CFBP 13594]